MSQPGSKDFSLNFYCINTFFMKTYQALTKHLKNKNKRQWKNVKEDFQELQRKIKEIQNRVKEIQRKIKDIQKRVKEIQRKIKFM